MPGIRPKLIKATLRTYTHDEDRDHDTCIGVEVRTADQQTMIAAIDKTECSGEYGYSDWTWHEFDVPKVVFEIHRDSCEGFQFRMAVYPNGHDKWTFDAYLILLFSDGSTLQVAAMNQFFDCPWNNGCQSEWWS